MGYKTKGRISKVLLLAALLSFSGSFAQADAKRSITKIAGDLYRFQNNFHYSVFLVTSDGIIVTDPINTDAARWLKAELAKRFNKPIRYMIYSHDHVDHIAGGEVFADTAVVVAHENAKADIIAEQRPTAVPGITFSDQMTIELGGQTCGVELCQPKSLGQHDCHAFSGRTGVVRGRLYSSEVGGMEEHD